MLNALVQLDEEVSGPAVDRAGSVQLPSQSLQLVTIDSTIDQDL
jgi:hypothetical protein